MSVPNSMRAIHIKDGKGPSSSLYIDDSTSVPKLDGDSNRQEILVKVVAFGLNRMDILQREGQYPLPPGASPILGVEFSGTVADAGNSSFKNGEEVFGLATGGAYAEYIKVPAKMTLHKPKELSWEQAAAIPESESNSSTSKTAFR
jgi:NADPH:quinone reductase-like Zn-dependent oxidoreductase